MDRSCIASMKHDLRLFWQASFLTFLEWVGLSTTKKALPPLLVKAPQRLSVLRNLSTFDSIGTAQIPWKSTYGNCVYSKSNAERTRGIFRLYASIGTAQIPWKTTYVYVNCEPHKQNCPTKNQTQTEWLASKWGTEHDPTTINMRCLNMMMRTYWKCIARLRIVKTGSKLWLQIWYGIYL